MRSLLLTVLAFAGAPIVAQETPASTPPAPASEESAAQPTQELLAPVRVDPVELQRRLASLYEGTLIGVQDGQEFAETPNYRRLLQIVSGYGENELRSRTPPLFDRAAALATPDAFRGEIVKVRGLLAGLTAERLSYPIGEQVDVFRAVVTEPDGVDAIVVDFLHQPPSDLDLGNDMVETEAVFVRTVGYISKKDIPRQAPYLIARDLRRWDTTQLTRRTAFDTFAKYLIGAAVAFIVVRIFMSMRTKKDRGAVDSERASQLIRERSRIALKSRPPAGKP